jgi:putative ABC transport system permease protein
MEALTGILFLLGFLAVFLSGFLITNTLQAIVQQQIQQIGILKTLGARKSQIVVLYMALILMFGLAGALIAIPLAQQISFQRLGQLTASVNVHYRGARLVPQAILIQAFLAIIVPQVAALFPILQGAQLSVSEALIGIRQSGKSRRSRFDQHITRLKLFSLSTLLSIRNTFRRTGRLALTLVTLSLGGAIFIATFNIQASMDEQVKLVSRYFLADVNITLTSPRRILEVQRLLGDVPGVGYVEGWAAGRGEMVLPDNSAGPPIQLLGPPANTRLVEPQVLKGRWVQPGDVYAIALNERFLLDYPQYQVGGVIPLRINGKDRLWTIVGFFQLAGKNSSLIGYTHYDSLSAASGQLGQAFTYRVVADQPDLSADAQRALGIAIEKRLKAAGVHAADLTTGNFIAGNAAQGFSILNGFLLFLATLTAIVGSIGLAGSMSLNVMERTREIGVLRAIGATNRILARLVISEGVLVGGMSWVIAALAAIPISKVLSDSVSYAIFGNPTTLQLTPTGFLLWLGAVLLLSILAGVIPARSAAQLTIREVLAYE